MNEELLVSLAEAMLNEGIDEDSIINILSNLVEEQEEVLPVSESCFDSIVSLTEAIIQSVTEGIMDDIKGGMDPEKAKAKWVKQKNKEFIEAVKKEDEANRLLRKAKKRLNDEGRTKAYNNLNKAERVTAAKFNTQDELNYRKNNNATFNKMVIPVYNYDGDKIVGFEKGGKPYKPEKD